MTSDAPHRHEFQSNNGTDSVDHDTIEGLLEGVEYVVYTEGWRTTRIVVDGVEVYTEHGDIYADPEEFLAMYE